MKYFEPSALEGNFFPEHLLLKFHTVTLVGGEQIRAIYGYYQPNEEHYHKSIRIPPNTLAIINKKIIK